MSAAPKATLHEFQFALLSKLLKGWPAGDIQFILKAINSYDELLEYRYWASLLSCDQPAGVDCSKIDLKGGEAKCFPCKAREDIAQESQP